MLGKNTETQQIRKMRINCKYVVINSGTITKKIMQMLKRDQENSKIEE